MYVEKAAEMTFVQKTRAYNVDEIDTYVKYDLKCYWKFWHVLVKTNKCLCQLLYANWLIKSRLTLSFQTKCKLYCFLEWEDSICKEFQLCLKVAIQKKSFHINFKDHLLPEFSLTSSLFIFFCFVLRNVKHLSPSFFASS